MKQRKVCVQNDNNIQYNQQFEWLTILLELHFIMSDVQTY